MDRITEYVEGMDRICQNLERNAKEQPLFIPEYDLAMKINGMIKEKPSWVLSDTIEVIRMLNELDLVEHYDGSGWFDYKLRLLAWLGVKGFEVRHKNYKELEVEQSYMK